MKLGIIGAMQVEVETLLEKLEDKRFSHRAGSDFYEGVLEGLNVVIVQCGVGKVNAAICAQILCDRYEVTHILNTGIAGSLNAELDIGDLVVSEDAIHHDFDISDINPDRPVGHVPVPGGSIRFFPADAELMACAFAAAETVHAGHTRVGRIASGDQFIGTSAKKQKIIAETAAMCAEMEGAAIAHTAWRNGIPFVILRAISDKADNSAEMDYPTFEAIAAHRCAAVTLNLAKALAEKS